MVKLRLRRKGRKNYPVYDVVAMDGRARRDGAFLDRLGWYDPNQTPNVIEIDAEKALHWLSVGAQPTDTVRHLMSYEGILLARHMQFKNKTAEEIAEAVKKHKEVSSARYDRRKVLRKKRIEAKKKAEADAKAQEKAG